MADESAPADKLATSAAAIDSRTIAVLALVGAATIWGTAAIGTKTALETYPIFVLACARWVVSLAAMAPILRLRRIRPVIDRRTALLGLTGILGFQYFFSAGLERTTAANGSLISGALAAVVATLSFLFLKERLKPIWALGIALSMIGVAATVLGATLDASVLGNLLVFCSVLAWAIYTIGNREWLRGENPMAVTVGAALFGLMYMLPLAAVEAVHDTPDMPSLGLAAIVVYLSLGPSMGAILLWTFALTRVPASQAAVFSNLTPIVGIAAAGLILKEPITRYHVIGSVLVVLGVWLTTLRRQPSSGQSAASMKSIATKPVSPAAETSIQR